MKRYEISYRIGHGADVSVYSALSYGVDTGDALWNFYTASLAVDTHVISIVEL